MKKKLISGNTRKGVADSDGRISAAVTAIPSRACRTRWRRAAASSRLPSVRDGARLLDVLKAVDELNTKPSTN